MTLTDPAEGRAWAVWLLDHEPGLIPRSDAGGKTEHCTADDNGETD